MTDVFYSTSIKICDIFCRICSFKKYQSCCLFLTTVHTKFTSNLAISPLWNVHLHICWFTVNVKSFKDVFFSFQAVMESSSFLCVSCFTHALKLSRGGLPKNAKSLHLFDLDSILLAVESSLQVSSCLQTLWRPRHLTVSSIKCWYSSLAQIHGFWIVFVVQSDERTHWSVQPLPKTMQDAKTIMLLFESLMFQQIVSYGLDQTENNKKVAAAIIWALACFDWDVFVKGHVNPPWQQPACPSQQRKSTNTSLSAVLRSFIHQRRGRMTRFNIF